MMQEEKQLLLKDLCARLPYKVKVEAVPYVDPQILCSIDPIRKEFRLDFGEYRNIFATNWVGEEYSIVKPYLRPMSSMTSDERIELSKILNYEFYIDDDFALAAEDDRHRVRLELCEGYIDWLNGHMFDYRELIEKGLALEAKEGMYKTE